MFSLVYTSAILGTICSGAVLGIIYHLRGRFYGRSLSQWIIQTSHKTDDISAEKLQKLRKMLEVLAHDVLKHRILGLASLIQELRDQTDDGKNIEALPSEKQITARGEIFRLSGIKLAPEERLWTRWIDCFLDMFKHAGRNIISPAFDPMFAATSRELLRLRGLITSFVDRESSDAEFLTKVMKLRFEECVDIYPKVLALANASQMLIVPDDIVKKAVMAVAAQTKRSDIASKIRILNKCGDKVHTPVSPATLIMCLTRLIDNALDCGEKAAIDIELDIDDFMGTTTLLFKVYDMSSNIPDPSEYGMGIRGIRQSIAVFDGGFQFRQESREEFKKAAVLSFPAASYAEFHPSKLKRSIRIVSTLGVMFVLLLFLLGLSYVIGGPPVEFAGKGTNIIEFTVKTGDELVIPLCSGGRNVRAEVNLANEACITENCTFGNILDTLEPCRESIKDPQCPGEIRWKPGFDDGLRQGKNYELVVHCIAEGPPESDDEKRIRVIVSRQNTAPKILMTQLINQTRGQVFHVQSGQTIKAGVLDEMTLRCVAADDDADMIQYTLHRSDGTSVTSTNGTFHLAPTWSLFGTSTFELEISDGIAPAQKMPIILEADELHPIELQKVALWSKDSTIRHVCDGTSESRICHLPNRLSNVIEMQIWFDPIQQRVRPRLEFGSHESQGFEVKPQFIQNSGFSRPGDQWELYSKQTKQLIGVIELTNIEKTTEAGHYRLTFSMLTSPAPTELNSMALNFTASDQSGRLPILKTILILTRQNDAVKDYLFNTQHVELTEFDEEKDAGDARANVWINANRANRSAQQPVIESLSCMTPEYAEALEKPVISDHHNAWKVQFALRRGCIPGLSQSMPGKSRLCAANIQLGNEQTSSEVIWVMLNPRSCAPKIESLTLASDTSATTSNQNQWNFKIIDPDGDLPIQNIEVTGTSEYSLQFETQSNKRGNVYTGTITMASSCEKSAISPGSEPMALRVTDNDKHQISRPLTVPVSCPPLVSTPKNQTHFEVAEGERLSIPLMYEDDVRLTLNNHFGAIRDKSFVWDATCLYGRGPHSVEIRADSAQKYGKPLVLDIEVTHCRPRFDITVNDNPINPSSPVIAPASMPQNIRIHLANSSHPFQIEPHLQESSTILLKTIQSDSDWLFELTCTDEDSEEDIEFRFADEPGIEPIRLTVQCAAW